MKHKSVQIFSIIILLIFYFNLFSQTRKELLESSKAIQYKEYLQIRLDILSVQISNGSIYFMDMISSKITNTIEVNSNGTIFVEIYFDQIDKNKIQDINIRKSIIEEQLTYFKVCLKTMMTKYISEYNFNSKNDLIIKSYYKSEGSQPEVFHYDNDNITWYNP